jgi:AraC-like DNA-binding protein
MMNKKNLSFILVVLIVFSHFATSQSRIQSIKDSINANFYSNPLKAKLFSHQFLALAKGKKDKKEESKAYCFLAELSGVTSQKDSAFYYFDRAIQKALEIHDTKQAMYQKITKANYLFAEYDFDSALTLYNECLILSKKNNDTKTYEYIIIKKASVNYEIGKYEEALVIFKKGLKNKDFPPNTILGIKLSLSKSFLKINEPDSALVFSKQGIIDSKNRNLLEFEMHFYNQQGLIYIYKNDYVKAKISLDSALFLAKKSKIVEMERLILINKSKLFTVNKEQKNAIELLNSIVKDESNLPISTENLAEINYLLAENYKETNNLALSNVHFQQYIEQEKKLGQKKVETIDHLHQIDISEIQSEKEEQAKQKWIVAAIAFFSIVGGLILFYRKNKQDKQNQLRFESLLEKLKNQEALFLENANLQVSDSFDEKTVLTADEFDEEDTDTSQGDDIDTNDLAAIDHEVTNHSAFVIKDGTISEVLDKLLKLEEKKYYLKQECTLHNIAKKLKTNTAYLSKIVNSELGKSFSTYINELRINYIILELKNNSKLRAYSIHAIAEEIGYKSSESFTKYFKIATGITPAIYIKKINELHQK